MASIQTVMLWLIVQACYTDAQTLFGKTESYKSNGICKRMICDSIEKLKELEDCVVILGDLQIVRFERMEKKDFENLTFKKLREVTGFVVFYRVNGLESLGQLFPNLARIRGDQVLNDFSLIIYDMEDLNEIGLYNLLKIDRGGVIIWMVPQACFVNTVNWKAIAPRARRVLGSSEGTVHCTSNCRCTTELETNYCWNIKMCQRYYEGPEAEHCHEQCFGCRLASPSQCLLCRHYTYKHRCIESCPNHTIILPVNKYCITVQECEDLGGWVWKNTCIFECPIDYIKHNLPDNTTTCMPCKNCEETCESLKIQSTSSIQAAKRCVYVNGSLIIHIRSVPEVMEELRAFLSRIQNVTDFIEIYGSVIMTSLDFFTSLKYIGGNNLYNNSYSLVVHDMVNLQTLFSANVTKNLIIGRGTMSFYRNPVLCVTEINKLMSRFHEKPKPFDVPQATNGYSGGCKFASIPLNVTILNETSVSVTFLSLEEPDVHYSLLYVLLPLHSQKVFVPETCSESEWHAVNVPTEHGQLRSIELTALRPASEYALCIETYNPKSKYIARGPIYNFSTPVGKPEPSFISELVAKNDEVVVIRWVNHLVYRPYIVRYELDVSLIDIHSRDVTARNHCNDDFEEIDEFRHAMVFRPPADYDQGCESMCGVLSESTKGALVEDYFDVCSDMSDDGCNVEEASPPLNTTFGKYVRTLFLNISASKTDFQIGELAPFRDYRFRLRACTHETCSRSARGVVRTERSEYADIPSVSYASANELGYISVSWRPPDITNGPVLAYMIEIIPKIKVSDIAHLVPRSWCVSSNELNIIVKFVVTKKYLVRVCSTTLASKKACGDFISVIVSTEYSRNWAWVAFIIALLIFTASLVVGRLWRRRSRVDDMIPLVENIYVLPNENQSPSIMSEFIPSYSILLNENTLEECHLN